MTVLYKVRKPAGSVAGVIFSFIALVILAVPYAGAGENREAIVAEQEAIRELFDAGECEQTTDVETLFQTASDAPRSP